MGNCAYMLKNISAQVCSKGEIMSKLIIQERIYWLNVEVFLDGDMELQKWDQEEKKGGDGGEGRATW